MRPERLGPVMATTCRSPSPSPSVAHHHQVVDRRLPAPRPRSQLTIDAVRRSFRAADRAYRPRHLPPAAPGRPRAPSKRDRLDAVITGLLFIGDAAERGELGRGGAERGPSILLTTLQPFEPRVALDLEAVDAGLWRSGVIQTMRASTKRRPRAAGVSAGIRATASSAIRNQTSPRGADATRTSRRRPGPGRAGGSSAD